MKKTKKILCLFVLTLFAMFLTRGTTVNAATLKVSQDSLKSDIAKYSVSVSVDNEVQTFSIDKSEIKKLKVNSKKYNESKTEATVKATVYIDRSVATVKGKVTIKYKYNAKKEKWTIKSFKYSKTSISKINLKGEWSGRYVAGQGETKINVTIPSVTSDGFIKDAVLSFSAVPTNPTVPSGSYSIIGGYDLTTGVVNFSGNEWIERPGSYGMINFMAHVDLLNKKIVDDQWSLKLEKE